MDEHNTDDLTPRVEEDSFSTVYLAGASDLRASKIGRYRQVRKLGEGAFGVVWLGFDDQLQRPVAIKITKAQPSAAPEIELSQFDGFHLQEARNVAILDHPHIVPVYDVGTTDDNHFYVVSKYIEGETLRSAIQSDHLSVSDSIAVVRSIAEALAHAHDRDIVHRDVKPENILIDRHRGHAHLTDFGLSFRRFVVSPESNIAGTPQYMSPEQVRGDIRVVDARSDLFSLGVVLYELLLRRPPFEAPNRNELFAKIIYAEPDFPVDEAARLGEDLVALCRRSLAKSPNDRFSSAMEMAKALAACAEKLQSSLQRSDEVLTLRPSGLLGEYRLLELIGEGGGGDVYRAVHRAMQRTVAIKLLHPSTDASRDRTERFLNEIRVASQLFHKNIVKAFDAGYDADRIYLVMEYIEGESLADRLSRFGPLSSPEAMNALRQTAMALEYAHALKVVHRDIKPGNLMLASDGVIKVLDFGIACSNRGPIPTAGGYSGTPQFMAPEQTLSANQPDPRSDLYSLGATLYGLLTGRPMFEGDYAQIAIAHQHHSPPNLYDHRPDIDLRIDAIYKRLVAKSPDDRFSSARALIQTIDRLQIPERPISTAPGRVFLKGRYQDQPTSVHESPKQEETPIPAIGIDFGSDESTVAWYQGVSGPHWIEHPDGRGHYFPNMLWSIDSNVELGLAAIDRRQAHPSGIFHSIQRWIGLPRIHREFGGRQVPPELLMASILHRLLENSRRKIAIPSRAVVTVPSCYDQIHRRAIQVACQLAGLEPLQLLDKPLAAVLAWLDALSKQPQLRQPTNSIVLVAHLGSTCLESSIVEVIDDTARLRGTQGDWHCGSPRWIHALAEKYSGELKARTGADLRSDPIAAARLQRTVERVLERLTNKAAVEMRFDWRGTMLVDRIDQDRLLEMVPMIRGEVRRSILAACDAAKIDIDDVDHIVLTGGLMRMRPIRRIVESIAPQSLSVTLLDKREHSRGAAIQARWLSTLHRGAFPKLHAETCSVYDFAVPLLDAGSAVLRPKLLLERGVILPTKVTRTLRVQEPHSCALQLIESTRQGGNTWNCLGSLDLQSILPSQSLAVPLALQLGVDESGLLKALLTSPSTATAVPFPMVENRVVTEQFDSWRNWLDTLMLCAT